MPLALSDDQLAMIENFARPLRHLDRAPFLAAVARLLNGREIGDGALNRACREAQAEFLHPPSGIEMRAVSKHAR
jgi:hypothetical protein